MNVVIISTGGTIGAMPHDDPQKPPRDILIPPDKRDYVREYLAGMGIEDAAYIDAGQRDSKHIDEAYRLNLQKLIEKADSENILITHGTDTLLQTADFLQRQAQDSAVLAGKVIVLTGSMVPLANGSDSDGFSNLTFALGLLTRGEIEPGLYIVLSDYEFPDSETGWVPRLYTYRPGQYKKFFDPQDGRYNRLLSIKE